jgi:outer membrane protein W
MKKIVVLMMAALVVSTTLVAQEIRPVAKAGAKSINFTFGGLGAFGIGPAGVEGGLSASYFLSNDAAVRVGLQVVSNSTTTPWNGANAGSDGSTSALGLAVGADYLMYVYAMTPRVKPYLGVGAYVATNSSSTKPAISNAAGNNTVTETKNGGGNDGLAFGVIGIVGAEFFIYSEISLSAEYQLNVFSLASRYDRVVSYKGNPSVTTKQGSATQILGFGTLGATLHIYF